MGTFKIKQGTSGSVDITTLAEIQAVGGSRTKSQFFETIDSQGFKISSLYADGISNPRTHEIVEGSNAPNNIYHPTTRNWATNITGSKLKIDTTSYPISKKGYRPLPNNILVDYDGITSGTKHIQIYFDTDALGNEIIRTSEGDIISTVDNPHYCLFIYIQAPGGAGGEAGGTYGGGGGGSGAFLAQCVNMKHLDKKWRLDIYLGRPGYGTSSDTKNASMSEIYFYHPDYPLYWIQIDGGHGGANDASLALGGAGGSSPSYTSSSLDIVETPGTTIPIKLTANVIGYGIEGKSGLRGGDNGASAFPANAFSITYNPEEIAYTIGGFSGGDDPGGAGDGGNGAPSYYALGGTPQPYNVGLPGTAGSGGAGGSAVIFGNKDGGIGGAGKLLISY